MQFSVSVSFAYASLCELFHCCSEQFVLQEVDITLPDNSAWYKRYKYDIPVFHLNGQFLMKHQVDIEKLENQLSRVTK